MGGKRALAVTRRIFKELKNDKRTIGMLFFAPILAMCVFGLAFSGEVKNVHVYIVNHDNSTVLFNGTNLSFSKRIISNLDTDVLNIEYLSDEKDAKRRVEDGKAYAVIIFPHNFTVGVMSRIMGGSTGNPTIEILADRSNVNVASAVIKGVGDAVQKTTRDFGKEPPVSINTDNAIYGKNAKFIDFFVPGVMVFVVFLLTTLLTLISFVGERTSGNLERLLTTPLREGEIVGGYAVAFTIIGTIQTIILLSIGILVFKITVVGNLILAFLVIEILAVVSLSLGIMLSSFARREAQAVQFLPLIVLPVFLLSGIFWPLEAIPSWLRPASYFIPPTYAIDACRSVMLRGWGFDKVWVDIAALLGFAGAFLAAATFSLRKRRG